MTPSVDGFAASWTEPCPDRPVPFWSSVAADICAHVSPEDRPRSRRGWLPIGFRVVLGSAGFHAVLMYRLGHAARPRWWLGGRLVSGLLFRVGRHWYGCSLAATARLYGGLMLPHPQGIVVGGEAVLGPRAWIFQNVTLGGAPGHSGMPRIGADARIYAGAVVSGPVTIGDNVVLGANTVTTQDVSDRCLVKPAASVVVPLPGRFLANELPPSASE